MGTAPTLYTADPGDTLLAAAESFVRQHVPDHLRGLWDRDMETQLSYAGKEIRIPHHGNTAPAFDDTAYYPPIDTLNGVGVTGWDWRDGKTDYITIDVDGLDHKAGHAGSVLDDLIQRFSLLDEVELIRSKGGQGIHARVYFDPDHAPKAKTRGDHLNNARCVIPWLSERMGIDLSATADCVGVVAWVWHRDAKPDGFTLLKKSTAFMPRDWDATAPAKPASEPTHDPFAVTPKHKTLIDWLTTRQMAEFANGRLNTHTFNLVLAAQDKTNKIVGSFATLASGADGSADRNCFAYPDADGSWRVYRHGKNVKEHESWWDSPNGWTTTWFNRGREQKLDPTATIVALAKDDELFHDVAGRTYTTTLLRGVKETVQLADAQNRAKLRLAYTERTGRIASNDNISTAIDQLSATALLERPQYPVSIRLAEHGGKIYIDLANRERQIVEVRSDGWRVVNDAPVRFVRPFGLLPLPVPLPGGKLTDLKQFANVDDDDLPLLGAFIVGCFHPTGPYALLQLVGEQGSAKSSLMRLLHDLIDPNLAVGNTLPKDEEDFLVSAQLRWLMSFDNVDALNRKLSSHLCMIVTGIARAARKRYTDADQSILRAKRPVILTSIAEVVTASDLLDRTLTPVLPPIDAANRKSEFAIAQELRRDGVRGRILGCILDGVSSALAGHANVKRDNMPRLADFFSWATAAERGLGLDDGAVIATYVKQQANDTAQSIDGNPFAEKVIGLCKAGFEGTAKALADRLKMGITPREVGSSLREIAPDLRRAGYVVDFRRANGKKIVHLAA